jgi:small conductance mechanosensitive channel
VQDLIHADFDAIFTRTRELWEGGLRLLPNVLFALVALTVFVMLAGWVRRGVQAMATRARQPRTTALVLGRVASWGVYLLAFLVLAAILVPSLSVSSIFGALGIGGVAIGFAFKDVLQNLLAGLLLLITRPFRVGDQIVSGSHEGTIEDILVRSTLLRTYDNRVVHIPNSELFTSRVTVNTANDRRRHSLLVTGPRPASVEAFKQQLLAVMPGLDGLLAEPAPEVLIKEVAADTLTAELRFWVQPPTRRLQLEVQDEVMARLMAAQPEMSAKPA